MDWSRVKQLGALSLPDRLSVQLEKLIIDGEIEAGSKLPAERELAEVLGVSRVSIRQALRELEVRGMVDRAPGRGTTVLSPIAAAHETGSSIATAISVADRDIASIMELRAIIEPPIAAITAERATSRDVAQLQDLVDQMSLNVPVARYVELDVSFHQSIANYSHNPLLSVLAEQIAGMIAPSRNASLQTKQRRRNSTAQHQKILDAIASHDPAAARREAANHLQSITEEIQMTQSNRSPKATR